MSHLILTATLKDSPSTASTICVQQVVDVKKTFK